MILVTGATGLNGSELVRKLSEKRVPVRALTRSAAKATGISSLPGVETVEGDMSRPETLAGPLSGIQKAMLISSSDAKMTEIQTAFIMAAKKAGVKHIVKLSGIMPELNSSFRFARMHAEIEKVLEESGVPFTHLRCGEFMHAYFRQVPSIVNKGALFLPMANAKIACIDIGDIVDVAFTILTSSGSEHEGKTYSLTGPEALTMTDVAAKLSGVIGREIRYVDVPPEDAKKAQLAAGVPPYLADALFELFAERRKGKESQVWPTVQNLLNRPATSFSEFAKRYASIFRGEEPAPRV